jgi:hypothetical protein
LKGIDMGIFSDFSATSKIESIKRGRSESVSKSSIINMVINMQKAQRNLNASDYELIWNKFNEFRKDTHKQYINYRKYIEMVASMLFEMDLIAPCENYEGLDSFEYYDVMNLVQKKRDERRKNDAIKIDDRSSNNKPYTNTSYEKTGANINSPSNNTINQTNRLNNDISLNDPLYLKVKSVAEYIEALLLNSKLDTEYDWQFKVQYAVIPHQFFNVPDIFLMPILKDRNRLYSLFDAWYNATHIKHNYNEYDYSVNLIPLDANVYIFQIELPLKSSG